MKSRCLIIAALGLLVGCSPQSTQQNPRDAKGSLGDAVTWRVVAQGDGHAAFLSRPGAAPDLVFWCRDSREITLRAHVFQVPSSTPNLQLQTEGGTMVFTNVRRQGGVRKGDRILVEGAADTQEVKITPLLEAAGQLTLTSGAETYRADGADPNGVMSTFVAACKSLNTKPTIKK
jgi:hypothetical protein